MFLLKKTFITAYIYMMIIFQIILESLPISSSGHLKLLEILNQKFEIFFYISLKDFGLNFEILHLPSIFVIFVFFYKEFNRLIFFAFRSFGNFFKVLNFIFIADLVTSLLYILKKMHIFRLPLSVGFLVTGCILFFSVFSRDDNIDINFWDSKRAFILGLVQGVALLPGISRFATVFVASKYLGYSDKDSFFITFLIELPLLVLGVLKGFVCLYFDGNLINFENINLLMYLVIIMSSIFSYRCLAFVKEIIEKNKFWMISFYMLIPALVSFLMGV
jgi:undecaprenyl-diphosphatase